MVSNTNEHGDTTTIKNMVHGDTTSTYICVSECVCVCVCVKYDQYEHDQNLNMIKHDNKIYIFIW